MFQRVLRQGKEDLRHLSGRKAKNKNLNPVGNNKAEKGIDLNFNENNAWNVLVGLGKWHGFKETTLFGMSNSQFTSTDAALTGKNTGESCENPNHRAKMMSLPQH